MSNMRDRVWECLAKLKASQDTLTVTDLAKVAGISRSTLYKYYPEVVATIRHPQNLDNLKPTREAAIKIRILKNKLKDQKTLIDTLANICSAQLIELLELHASYQDQLELKYLRITALEKQISTKTIHNVKLIR